MVLVSRELLTRVKLSPEPVYRLARYAGCHPSTLSKLLHGGETVRPNDPRIVGVGRRLGLAAAECFADSVPPPAHAEDLSALTWAAEAVTPILEVLARFPGTDAASHAGLQLKDLIQKCHGEIEARQSEGAR